MMDSLYDAFVNPCQIQEEVHQTDPREIRIRVLIENIKVIANRLNADNPNRLNMSNTLARLSNDLVNGCYCMAVENCEIVESENKEPTPELTRIYLLKNKDGVIKIGRSKKPSARERTLQAQDPCLELIFQSEIQPVFKEKELHQKYAHKRVRGEWFRLDHNEIQEIINSLQ